MAFEPRADGSGRGEPAVRIVLRPLGSVLPLGFLAFGTGAFVTACLSLGWIAAGESRQAFVLVLVFTVPIQAVAAVLAVLSRDTPGGTTLGVFAATWAAVSVTSLTLSAGETSSALGVFLLADSVAIAILATAALAGNPAFTVLLGVAVVRFALGGIYELTGSTGAERASGWVGLALCLAAAYAGIALLLEDAKQEPVLPMLRQGPSRRAIEAGYDEQLRGLEREPGVRTTL
jgi:uncharacterized protein